MTTLDQTSTVYLTTSGLPLITFYLLETRHLTHALTMYGVMVPRMAKKLLGSEEMSTPHGQLVNLVQLQLE